MLRHSPLISQSCRAVWPSISPSSRRFRFGTKTPVRSHPPNWTSNYRRFDSLLSIERSKPKLNWITKYQTRVGQNDSLVAPPDKRSWWIEMPYGPRCGTSAYQPNMALEKHGWRFTAQRLVPCAQYLRHWKPPLLSRGGRSKLARSPRATTAWVCSRLLIEMRRNPFCRPMHRSWRRFIRSLLRSL